MSGHCETHQSNRRERRPSRLIVVVWRAVLIASVLASGCNPTTDRGQGRRGAGGLDTSRPSVDVFASSYAWQYLTQRLLGNEATVELAGGENRIGENWMPDRDELQRMQQARLIVVNGGGAESASWLDRVSLPPSILCETIQGMRLSDFIVVNDAPTHSHGPEGEHSHRGVAATTWLDPKIAQVQVEYLAQRLVTTFPDLEKAIRARQAELVADLQRLASRYQQVKPELAGRSVLSSEPAFKYLTRALGLNDQHFFWSQEQTPPTEEQWQAFDGTRDPTAAWMLWPFSPGDEIVAGLRQRGIKVLVIETLERPSSDQDFLESMDRNLNGLVEALQKTP